MAKDYSLSLLSEIAVNAFFTLLEGVFNNKKKLYIFNFILKGNQ